MPRKKETPKKEKVARKQRVTKEPKVKVEFDDFKDEVYKYTDDVVRKYYLLEIEKVNKAVIREKNRKILFRNFIITLLLLVIVYLLYLLTTVNYFSRFSDNNTIDDGNKSKEEEVVKTDTESNDQKHEPTLNELKEKYDYLLDSVLINEKSKYLKDYYSNNLTSELKNYLALNNLDFKKLDLVDNYNMFSEALIKDSFDDTFQGEYNSISFDYNGNNVRYISKLNSYITDSVLEKTKSNIKREITAINVSDNVVTITTVEGLIKDGKLYNVLTNKEVNDYHGDSIISYVDNLNKVTYTFNNKKISSIK